MKSEKFAGIARLADKVRLQGTGRLANIARLTFILFMVVCAARVDAAPFRGWFDYAIPGTEAPRLSVSVYGAGDEFAAVYESEDGRALLWNREARRYEFAVKSAGESGALVGSGCFLDFDFPESGAVAEFLAAKDVAHLRWNAGAGAYEVSEKSADGSFAGTGLFVALSRQDEVFAIPTHLRDTSDARKNEIAQSRMEQQLATRNYLKWYSIKNRTEPLSYEESVRESEATISPFAILDLGNPTVGTVVGLTILVDFPIDENNPNAGTLSQKAHPHITVDEIKAFLNADEYAGFDNKSSVRQYFKNASCGKYDYTNVVVGYVTMPSERSFYDDPAWSAASNAAYLLDDMFVAIRALPDYESKILPLLQQVSYNDSYFISLNILYAGEYPEQWGMGLWPHQHAIRDTFDYIATDMPVPINGVPKYFYDYQITPITSSPKIYTFCHENGHMLFGFPDFYDTDEIPNDSSGGSGLYCLMGYGSTTNTPVNISAYLRAAAGWVTPKEIPDEPGFLTVTSDLSDVWKYARPGTDTEYFLIENRQKKGQDEQLIAGGILIWHVDELGDGNNESREYNTLNQNFEVQVEQADGSYSYHIASYRGNDLHNPYVTWREDNGSSAYSGVFNYASVPNSRWWDGSKSGFSLRMFSANDDVMTFFNDGKEAASDAALPPAVVSYEEALECDNLVFSTFTDSATADAAWVGLQTRSAYDGTDCVISGNVPHGGKSVLTATTTGAGTIKFKWKVSSEKSDVLRFYIDKEEMDEISWTNVAWTAKSFAVTGTGAHTFKWEYVKDASGILGADCARLDEVEWIPADNVAPIMYSSVAYNGGNVAECAASVISLGVAESARVYFDIAKNANFSGVTSEQIATIGVPSDIVHQAANLEFGATYYARFRVVNASGETVGRTLSFTTRAGAPLVPDSAVLKANASSVDVRITIPAFGQGETYATVFADIATDAQFANIARTDTLGRVDALPATQTFTVGNLAFGTKHYIRCRVVTDKGGAMTTRAIYHYVDKNADVAELFAAATDSVFWNDQRNAVNWYIAPGEGLDGGACVRAGIIDDNETTTLNTTVTGPGVVSFWRRVSTFSSDDFLTFSINGEEKDRAYGYGATATNWVYLSYRLPAGEHRLAWEYTKGVYNERVRSLDTAWMDGFLFEPGELVFDAPSIGSPSVGGNGTQAGGTLSFGKDKQGREVFSVVVGNPQAEVWYTPFVATELGGEFVAGADSVQATTDDESLVLSILTAGANAQFVRVVASSYEFKLGDPMPKK